MTWIIFRALFDIECLLLPKVIVFVSNNFRFSFVCRLFLVPRSTKQTSTWRPTKWFASKTFWARVNVESYDIVFALKFSVVFVLKATMWQGLVNNKHRKSSLICYFVNILFCCIVSKISDLRRSIHDIDVQTTQRIACVNFLFGVRQSDPIANMNNNSDDDDNDNNIVADALTRVELRNSPLVIVVRIKMKLFCDVCIFFIRNWQRNWYCSTVNNFDM